MAEFPSSLLWRVATLLLAFCAVVGVAIAALAAPGAGDTPLPVQPQVTPHNGVTDLTLYAVPHDGKQSFRYDNALVPPIIRAVRGGQIRMTYVNQLPVHTTEKCALGTCMDMTNMHFHGLEVSPRYAQDDVLTMLAMPGQTLQYDVHLPPEVTPGLYWYHTHPHGESDEEALDGMTGAIVIEGIDRYVPQVRGLRERVLVVRENDTTGDPQAAAEYRRVGLIMSKNCGPTEKEPPEGILTVNGALRPSIAIAPGEKQFWRIVNASADRYVDVELGGSALQVVAIDGMPLAYHDPAHPTMTVEHFILPPAGRVEAIVTGPPAGAQSTLRTRCFNSGPAGDPMPGMTLADIVPQGSADEPFETVPVNKTPPVYKQVDLTALERTAPSFKATFTEGNHRFYINKHRFSPWSAPMTAVKVGTFVHWRIVNNTNEVHPFHIHQVHFLTYRRNGEAVDAPVWSDTMNVPLKGSIDVILDATNPAIRGMSVFHCHILSHEDKGMMAKVLFN